MRLFAAMLVVLLALAAAAQDPFGGGSRLPAVTFDGPEQVELAPGANRTVELRFTLDSGYHINSSTPSTELLIPTALQLKGEGPVALRRVEYPEGKLMSFPFAPEEKFSVYEGTFVLRAQLRAARGARPGNYRMAGQLRYQACSDTMCYPPRTTPVVVQVKVRN